MKFVIRDTSVGIPRVFLYRGVTQADLAVTKNPNTAIGSFSLSDMHDLYLAAGRLFSSNPHTFTWAGKLKPKPVQYIIEVDSSAPIPEGIKVIGKYEPVKTSSGTPTGSGKCAPVCTCTPTKGCNGCPF